MKNIYFVTSTCGDNGAERMIIELSKQWVKKGNGVTIIKTVDDKLGDFTIPNEIKKIDISKDFKFRTFKIIYLVKSIFNILKKDPNGIIISFLQEQSFIVAILSFFVNNKIIMSERNNPQTMPMRKMTRMLRDWAFTRATKCVFQTQMAKEYFSKNIQNKGFIIPNPINGSLPDPYSGERDKRIVMSCRLHSQKNIMMAIDAFELLRKDFPDYILVIYGQGPQEEELKDYIRQKDLTKQIYLAGFSNNIFNDIKKAKLWISSSNYEGISNSMLEAMALGLPVVVTDCPVGGAQLVIKNNENGILIPVGDVEALYKGMKKIITDEKFAKYISNNAVKIREEFPIEKIAERWIEIMN